MRIYDRDVSRFLSVDPIASQYPELTPYQFASNTPIAAIDIDGLEGGEVVSEVGKKTSAQITKQTAIELSKMTWDDAMTMVTGSAQTGGKWAIRAGGSLFGVVLHVFTPVNGGENDLSVQRHNEFSQRQNENFIQQFASKNAPQNLEENHGKGRIILGYVPPDEAFESLHLDQGHSFIGLSFSDEDGSPVEWYHLRGREGSPTTFVKMTPEEIMDNIFEKNAKIESKVISLERVGGGKLTAEAKVSSTKGNYQLYDIKENNCATNCTDVLRGSGYNPPNMQSKHPKYLFEWFKRQK